MASQSLTVAEFIELPIVKAGLPIEIMSAGGSGTYQVTPFINGVTEIEVSASTSGVAITFAAGK